MPMRVAVVGSGVSGISAAYHLRKHGALDMEVVLFEANPEKIGGHANTVRTDSMPHAVDAGFMVCNHDTYPNLFRWFADMGVPLEPTDMSFCVTDKQDRTWAFGWSIWAWARMLPTKRFWIWLANMDRFHREALAALETDDQGADETILEFLEKGGYDESLIGGWIIPFCAAVWSSPSSAAGGMNARALFVFLRNHGFLAWRVPHWLTPKGRCGGAYLPRAEAWFKEHNVQVRLGYSLVGAARLMPQGVELSFVGKPSQVFDKVVFATPAGACREAIVALRPDWHELMQGFRTHKSDVVLHSDAQAVMPRERLWWASWTVAKSGMFTYWLNNLQHQPDARGKGKGKGQGGQDLFETLNPPSDCTINESLVHGRYVMTHPVMDKRTLLSQAQYHAEKTKWLHALEPISGTSSDLDRSVFLAGAYLHHGFHEDGFRSGIEAARAVLEDPSIPLLPVPFARLEPMHETYRGHTFHARFPKPKDEPKDEAHNGPLSDSAETARDGCHSQVAHSFNYGVTYDYVDVSGAVRYWWGGLYREDHFGDPCVELHEEVRRRVCRETGVYPVGCVDLLCSLRAYGYCFNPISLFFVWSSEDRQTANLDFVVTEVTSTPWEQRTVHVLDLRNMPCDLKPASKKKRSFVRVKSIHVSPFNPVPDGEQLWEYTLHSLPGDKTSASASKGAGKVPWKVPWKVHVTVSLFASPERLAKRQATVVADLNLAKRERDPTKGVSAYLDRQLSVHAGKWWQPFAAMLPPLLPEYPPLPWSAINQLRIHFEAIRLFLKGLRFTPNTGWSTGSGSSCPLAKVARPDWRTPGVSGASSGGCPVMGCEGPGARSSPLFLEKASLIASAAFFYGVSATGWLSRPLALALWIAASLGGLEAASKMLPPDVTGRRLTL